MYKGFLNASHGREGLQLLTIRACGRVQTNNKNNNDNDINSNI